MKGNVYWITGLSCAGKTSVGKLLYSKIKTVKNDVVFLDGDVLRTIFGSDLGFSLEERKKMAKRNSSLCKFISDQGIDVICSTIGMFNEIRNWNSENISLYKEIYLKVPKEVLYKRDVRGLYKRALSGIEKNVVGIDIEAEEPITPDLCICNDGSKSIEEIVDYIIENLVEL